jgi:hypothetical protein
MPSHRPLLAIIFRVRRRQSGRDEIDGVVSDGVDAFGVDVLPILVRQFEAGSEFGFFESGDGCGDLVGHVGSAFSAAVLNAMDNIANDNHIFSGGC